MSSVAQRRGSTAMRRRDFSLPVQLARFHGLLDANVSYFDFGCGRGDDIRRLQEDGIGAAGWDPIHAPDAPIVGADVVGINYVVNVIENPDERARTLERAWQLAARLLVVAARLDFDRDDAHKVVFNDGWLTTRGTFQKFYGQEELGTWIGQVLDAQPVAAGPGVYYVFRDQGQRDEFLASRFRRRITIRRQRLSDQAFESHRELLEPLLEFVATRGRLPSVGELAQTDELVQVFGSLRQAFRIVTWVTDPEQWDRVRRERAVDVLVHLALARFDGRARFSDLAPATQLDVRAFHSSYQKACRQADGLLFAAGNREAVNLATRASGVGKLTPSALYVHHEALSECPALVRVYEGCARRLIGTVPAANIVKLSRNEPRVSYLEYPKFDTDPHPALKAAMIVSLQELRIDYRSYSSSLNPPILHRKEEFVSATNPWREKYARLTQQEERAGLYADSSAIGNREGWQIVLSEAGVRLAGHRLVKDRRDAD